MTSEERQRLRKQIEFLKTHYIDLNENQTFIGFAYYLREVCKPNDRKIESVPFEYYLKFRPIEPYVADLSAIIADPGLREELLLSMLDVYEVILEKRIEEQQSTYEKISNAINLLKA